MITPRFRWEPFVADAITKSAFLPLETPASGFGVIPCVVPLAVNEQAHADLLCRGSQRRRVAASLGAFSRTA